MNNNYRNNIKYNEHATFPRESDFLRFHFHSHESHKLL